MWGRGPTDSEVINESQLGPDWRHEWNAPGRTEFITLSIFIIQASVVAVTLIRLTAESADQVRTHEIMGFV